MLKAEPVNWQSAVDVYQTLYVHVGLCMWQSVGVVTAAGCAVQCTRPRRRLLLFVGGQQLLQTRRLWRHFNCSIQ